MPESDMQPSPIADTVMQEEPSTRVGSFSTLLMFCHLTEFLTPRACAIAVILWGRMPQATNCVPAHAARAAAGKARPAARLGRQSYRFLSVPDRQTLTCSPASECVSATRTRSCGPNSLDSNILVLCSYTHIQARNHISGPVSAAAEPDAERNSRP